MRHSVQGEVKALVRAAIQSLSKDGWTVDHGGVWSARHIDLTVRFNKPNAFCTKVTWRLQGADLGVWTGSICGPHYDGLNEPNQIYTPAQVAAMACAQKPPGQKDLANLSRGFIGVL